MKETLFMPHSAFGTEKPYMTLVAYVVTGKKITHEYWGRPYAAPVKFEQRDRHDDDVQPGVAARTDFDASKELDKTLYPYNSEGEALRWMCESGLLWADTDLIFKEETG